MKFHHLCFFSLLLITNYLSNAQELKPKIIQFYKIIVSDDSKYQYVIPDSLKNNLELGPFATNMWAFNNYLYANYSIASKKYQFLDSLLPDRSRLINEFNQLLNNDFSFKNLFYNSFNKKIIPPIKIDSLQTIMARFFYMHKLENGEITLHMCTTVNEVLKMRQNENSPYYNAFCFMVLADQLPYEKINSVILYAKPDDSADRLEELRKKNYENLSTNLLLRKMIILEFEQKKQFLNFNLIY